MFNEAHISLSGYVATQPALRETRSGIPWVSMRVAWTPRRMDRASGEWVDTGTSFASVQLYRKLAENAATCLRKGDPVVVRGRVTVRDFETRSGQQRTVVEIDATSVGHDLSHGIATFHRVRPQTGMTAAEFRAAGEAGLSGTDDGPAGAGAGLTGDELEPAGPELRQPGPLGLVPAGDAGPESPGDAGQETAELESREPAPADAGQAGAGQAGAGPDDGQQAGDGQRADDGPGRGRGKVGGRAGARERALAQV
jgi:single-strand DNA-binding protein